MDMYYPNCRCATTGTPIVMLYVSAWASALLVLAVMGNAKAPSRRTGNSTATHAFPFMTYLLNHKPICLVSQQMLCNMARVEYIDRLKGFAILCVVVGHFTLWAYGINNDPVHDFVYLFHMPLFIFLSGIVIGSAPKISKVVVKTFQFLCPFFILGFMTRKYNLANWLLSHNTIFSFAILAIIPFSILYFSGLGHLYNLIAFAFIVVFVFLFKLRDNKTSIVERELSRLGRGSLNIYIFHYFVIHNIHLEKVGGWLLSSGNTLLLILLNIAISVIVAYISLGFGKLIQLSELIQGIVYGNYIKRLINQTE